MKHPMSKTFLLFILFLFSLYPLFSSGSLEESTEYTQARESMVKTQIEARGIRDPKVLLAMRKVP
ncbi:MAG TPA: hypothetical protein PLG79_14320, partial [Spirochaetales bacterium]|nr:hypothetical protein [Spirochaetales bacterium]